MKKSTAALLLNLLLVLFFAISVRGPQPPPALPDDAAAERFSAARAHRHLAEIARSPHPMGTAEHRRVRDYIASEIAALGLEPQLQQTTVAVRNWMGEIFGHVANVAARVEGRGDGPAVLLMSHYDTMPHSPGAGDDGTGVAVLLETARALRQGTPPANDVIFLFTDGEEPGLLGARAFAEQHPWSADVGLVMNFEARGSRGPALMFETSAGNGPLIAVLERAVDAPAATSYSYEIYRRMPNDTDFSVFRRRQVPGLNFAFIHGGTAYHTAQDSLDRLDLASVQHMGDAALDLARAFGDADLAASWQTSDAIYFNLLGPVFIAYPGGLALPLAALLAAAAIVVLVVGFRRGRLTAGGLAGAFAVNLLGAAAGGAALGFAAGKVMSFYNFELGGGWASQPLALLGLGLAAAGATLAVFRWLNGRIRGANLVAAGLVVWLVLTVAVSLAAPGASYLFAWPLAAALVAAALGWKRDAEDDVAKLPALALAVAAALTVLLWAPTLNVIGVALGPGAAGLVGATVFLLLFGPLAPVLVLSAARRRRYLLPAAVAAAGVVLVAAVQASSGFDAENRRPQNLFYTLDATTGEARWMSLDGAVDPWTSRYLTADPQTSDRPSFVLFGRPSVLASAAPAAPLAAPEVGWLAERDGADGTAVDLAIRWPYEVHRALLFLRTEAEIRAVASDGQRLELAPSGGDGEPQRVIFFAPPATGLELTVELAEARPLELEVVGQRYDLPAALGVEPRPADKMPRPGWESDSTFVVSAATWTPGSAIPPAEVPAASGSQ